MVVATRLFVGDDFRTRVVRSLDVNSAQFVGPLHAWMLARGGMQLALAGVA